MQRDIYTPNTWRKGVLAFWSDLVFSSSWWSGIQQDIAMTPAS